MSTATAGGPTTQQGPGRQQEPSRPLHPLSWPPRLQRPFHLPCPRGSRLLGSGPPGPFSSLYPLALRAVAGPSSPPQSSAPSWPQLHQAALLPDQPRLGLRLGHWSQKPSRTPLSHLQPSPNPTAPCPSCPTTPGALVRPAVLRGQRKRLRYVLVSTAAVASNDSYRPAAPEVRRPTQASLGSNQDVGAPPVQLGPHCLTPPPASSARNPCAHTELPRTIQNNLPPEGQLWRPPSSPST